MQDVFLQYDLEYFRGNLKCLRVLDGINIMLYVSTNIQRYSEFAEHFRKTHESIEFIDLSKVPSATLADACSNIVGHHKSCVVFLGYIEPGWMLDLQSQTRIRRLFRKFPVGLVVNFTESLPFSWKNEIDMIYTFKPLNKDGEP